MTVGTTAAKVTSPALFILAAFSGAGLIFFLEPMVTKLVLPLLGGSPGVWNTCTAFFQAALLAGYGYAHELQRISSIRRQAMVHIGVLVLAGLALPVRVSGLIGDPPPDAPTLWLLGVLLLSIGGPFAALSATAPIVQAWHARTFAAGDREPYALYAASNLGSLLALLAYPILVEPLSTLATQRIGWSIAYCAFAAMMAALALTAASSPTALRPVAVAPSNARPNWRTRAIWVGLAAIPSSLMLGVTTHLSTDIASAPLLWAVPLALYLLTFVIAFQAVPAIRPSLALLAQAALLPACAFFLHLQLGIAVQVLLEMGCFFVTALVCHQALVARRPDPAHLTDFYLWMAVGGVVGGAFNAFLAPAIFNDVWEYPLVLILALLARPNRSGSWARAELAALFVGALAVGLIPATMADLTPAWLSVSLLLPIALVAAFLLRDRRWPLVALTVGLTVVAMSGGNDTSVQRQRSFFGVLTQSAGIHPGLGPIRKLTHGTTMHGAQAQDPRLGCLPLTYYAPETVIGSVFRRALAGSPPASIGVVGLGAGTVAAYTRPGDRLTFFEIDPLVVRVASDPSRFTFTTACAKGAVGYVLGDARLTLAKAPPASFDFY